MGGSLAASGLESGSELILYSMGSNKEGGLRRDRPHCKAENGTESGPKEPTRSLVKAGNCESCFRW